MKREQIGRAVCRYPGRGGFAWLELLLVLAICGLILQLFPSVGVGLLWAINPLNWPRTFWFALNFAIIIALVGVRFGPDLYHDWAKAREEKALEQQKAEKQQALKQERQRLEQVKESRKRRIY